MLEVWHADSLAGPMMEMKKAFENRIPDVMVRLTSGRSKELAERVLKGDACDVFASSDPAVVKGMFSKKVGGKAAASWYVVFSANEMVVITTGKGNPPGIRQMIDLARRGVKLARVTGEKDMATNRTVEFIKRAAAAEGKSDLSQKIIDGAVKENTIPDVLKAVRSGKADAGIVYLSAAVTLADAEIIRFPAQLNLSENIRNVATVPGTAMNVKTANSFVRFLLSAEGQQILEKTGQPPIVPPIKEGNVPSDISKE